MVQKKLIMKIYLILKIQKVKEKVNQAKKIIQKNLMKKMIMNLEKKSDSKSKRKSKSSKKDSLKKERSNKKINSLKNLKVTELQNLLVAQKKIKSGKKAELISRILTKKGRESIAVKKRENQRKDHKNYLT